MFPGESRRGSQYPERFSWEDDLLQQLFYRKPGSGGNYPLGGCTMFRSVPIPSTETSTTSCATSGPTPAGVPVAITSPGKSVIMREIQRMRSEEHTSELQSRPHLVCRLLLEKKK